MGGGLWATTQVLTCLWLPLSLYINVRSKIRPTNWCCCINEAAAVGRSHVGNERCCRREEAGSGVGFGGWEILKEVFVKEIRRMKETWIFLKNQKCSKFVFFKKLIFTVMFFIDASVAAHDDFHLSTQLEVLKHTVIETRIFMFQWVCFNL